VKPWRYWVKRSMMLLLEDMTASIASTPPGVLAKCSALVANAKSDGSSQVPDGRSGAAHAMSSTASHGATATAVGVTPAKAMTSRWRCD
jgi:hypothetical protein